MVGKGWWGRDGGLLVAFARGSGVFGGSLFMKR